MTAIGSIQAVGTTRPRLGEVVVGKRLRIGSDFSATHFSEEDFDGRMDPLLMVDHFVMTGPTFDPHLHAGISAVTVMFEDATGDFLNRDTLGRDVALGPGDLYWLAAASGAAHEERPADGARVHGLQIFVNLPARLKAEPARALHVRAADVPSLDGHGRRVRVVLGRSGGVRGAGGTPEEMTLLDGFLERGGVFAHVLPEGRQAWLYAVSGPLSLRCGEEERVLPEGGAAAVGAGREAELVVEAGQGAHFVLMAARPIREPFVKRGPLVMSTVADVERTLADAARGAFGRVPA
jgi:redox-sensitive bicupin YhaK (pirin superfamily)